MATQNPEIAKLDNIYLRLYAVSSLIIEARDKVGAKRKTGGKCEGNPRLFRSARNCGASIQELNKIVVDLIKLLDAHE